MMVILAIMLLIAPAAAESMTVTSVTPPTGINTTTVSITDLTGTGFLPGATVLLTPLDVNPVHRGSIADGNGGAPFLNTSRGVYVSGTYAYVVSTGSDALEIIDISNPASPVHRGSVVDGSGGALLNNPYSVFVSGSYAYIASTGSDALEIIDISDPASPVHRGSVVDGSGGALLDGPVCVFVSGNYAYVVSYDSSVLEIVDITNPTNPVHFASITDGSGSVPCLSLPTSVFVSGDNAYVTSAGSTALEIVNITDPANPAHLASLDNGNGTAPFLYDPQSIFVSGNYAYIASASDNRLEIVDVTDPVTPFHIASLQNGEGGAFLNDPYSVFVSGRYAYVASRGSNALEIIDIGTITAANVNVVSSTHITCTVNLTGAVPGQYNVVVTNPDGSFGTLPGGFTVIGAIPTTIPTPTPTPTATPTPTPTFTRLPTLTPTWTPAPYDNSGADSDPTPVPTAKQRTTATVNVGGYSSVYRANVTGTGISDLIITGSASSGPGTDLLPAPGTVYEYIDLLPARYDSIQESVISASVPRLWLNGHNLAPQDVTIYHLSDSTWKALPTTLVTSESGRSYYTALSPGFGRFAITGELKGPADSVVQGQTTPQGTINDMVKVPLTVTTVSRTPVLLQTTEVPAQPATQPSAGFSSLTIVAAILGIIILIGLALVVRRRKSDL
jgi:hypothetical protein